MTYVYHRVPWEMKGTTLFTLNELKAQHPDLYAEQAKKYKGREYLVEEKIPLWPNCKWNDVIFMSAIHPAQFRREWESVNKPLPRYNSYKFKISDLDPTKLGVYLYKGGEVKHFEPFDPSKLSEYSVIREHTKEYWREKRDSNQTAFLFYKVPHILYHGALDTKRASVVWG